MAYLFRLVGWSGPDRCRDRGLSLEEVIVFRRAVHPGEVLKDELAEMGVTPTALAREIDVPPNRIGQIIAGKRSVTGDTALRLGHWFGVEPIFWLNLQTRYDLVVAERKVGETVRALPIGVRTS